MDSEKSNEKGAAAKQSPPKPDTEALYPMQATSTLVIYDLRDPEAWEKAEDVRKAWGKAHSEVHTLDIDHIALVLKPGGAKPETEASA